MRCLCCYVSINGYALTRALTDALHGDRGGAQSTISTLWNMRENVRYIQNSMASVLDWMESAKNLVDWTMPNKVAICCI